jgi:hypothetical protein
VGSLEEQLAAIEELLVIEVAERIAEGRSDSFGIELGKDWSTSEAI